MISEPLVSVIIPVYNVEAYLRRLLDSIVGQTYRNLEIFCVDDGSTDSSLSILEEYAEKDARIRIFMQDRKGAGAARNLGLREVKGEYVYFADADDWCDVTLIEKAVSRAEESQADIVCFGFVYVEESGKQKRDNGYAAEWLSEDTKLFNYKDCPDRILNVLCPTPWSKLILREFLLRYSARFDETLTVNDMAFSAVAAAHAERIVILDACLYYYRVGHIGTISSRRIKHLMDCLTVVQSTISQVKNLPYFDEIKASIPYFEMDLYTHYFKIHPKDRWTPEIKAFYTAVHERLNSSECVDYERHLRGTRRVYKGYQILKNRSYEESNDADWDILANLEAALPLPRCLRPLAKWMKNHASPEMKAKIKKIIRW